MQIGNASGEIRHCVLPGRHSEEGVPKRNVHVLGVRVSTEEHQDSQREALDGLRACSQRGGKEADEGQDPRVGYPETNLREPARAGEALQPSPEGLAKLLQPLQEIGDACDLRLLRSDSHALGPTQVPQVSGKVAAVRMLVAEHQGQTASVVRPLARLWKSLGTDNGS